MADGQHSGPLLTRFSGSLLPWWCGGVALVLYLLTLNPWMSLSSMSNVCRVSGWLWRPELEHPLTLLVFLPFGLLPTTWLPLALNLFTALCAAGVIAILARSVTIWPRSERRLRRDLRVHSQRHFAAAVPPVLATLLCGLHLPFWEHATAASGEMVTLLLFAAALGSLLEYRLREEEVWLYGGAVVYGLGMANDWGVAGFLPLYIAGAAWVRGLPFYRLAFLWRLAAALAAGASAYLWLPAWQWLFGPPDLGFWEGLKGGLLAQKAGLTTFPRGVLWTLMVISAAPLILMGLRGRLQRADPGQTRVSVLLTHGIFHAAHAAFLALVVWVALEGALSPTHSAPGYPLLLNHYLLALAAGYCAGTLLLVHSLRINSRAGQTATAVAWAVTACLPVLLLLRNWGEIRRTNSSELHEFARELRASVPAQNCWVLSDDPVVLYLMHAEAGRSPQMLPLDTRALPRREYHEWLGRKYGEQWPRTLLDTARLTFEAPQIAAFVASAAASRPLCYLHPSFGYFFESFEPRAQRLGFSLTLRGAPGPAAPKGVDSENAAYFDDLWPRVRGLALAQPQVPASRNRLGSAWPERRNVTREFLASRYSRAFNDCGVRLRRAGDEERAKVSYERALELRPDNPLARLNLDDLLARKEGRTPPPQAMGPPREKLGDYRSWDTALRENGPADEPSLLYVTAEVFRFGGNLRQALETFHRATRLEPQWPELKLGLAWTLLALGDNESALERAREVWNTAGPSRPKLIAEALECGVGALRNLGRTNEITSLLEEQTRNGADRPEILSMVAQLHLAMGQSEPALQIFDRILANWPNHAELLFNKGFAQMELNRLEEAIATLSRALTLSPTNHLIRFNRAMAAMRQGQFEMAEADYRLLSESFPRNAAVLLGLANTFVRRGDNARALEYFRQTLTNSPPGSAENQTAANAIAELTAAAAK